MICFSWFNRRHGSNCSGPRLFFSHLRLQNGNPPVRVGRVSQLASCPIITSTANPPSPLLYRLLYARIYDLSFNLFNEFPTSWVIITATVVSGSDSRFQLQLYFCQVRPFWFIKQLIVNRFLFILCLQFIKVFLTLKC